MPRSSPCEPLSEEGCTLSGGSTDLVARCCAERMSAGGKPEAAIEKSIPESGDNRERDHGKAGVCGDDADAHADPWALESRWTISGRATRA